MGRRELTPQEKAKFVRDHKAKKKKNRELFEKLKDPKSIEAQEIYSKIVDNTEIKEEE